jgi:RNA polymerase sigma-70 factor (ECF subfamily)
MKTLVNGIASGDPQAVTEFYKCYAPKLLRYLKKQLPAEEDAEEILNDVFLDAVDSISLLKKDSNLQAWIFRIAHNKTVNYYRKKKIKSILLSQIPYLELVDAEVHQPEFILEKNKVRDRIEIAFKSLPELYRKILKLRYEDGLSVKKIAEILELTFKATESLLFRARQSFRLAYERT